LVAAAPGSRQRTAAHKDHEAPREGAVREHIP
jgi:hypothetical protein